VAGTGTLLSDVLTRRFNFWQLLNVSMMRYSLRDERADCDFTALVATVSFLDRRSSKQSRYRFLFMAD
jgi:hypothetical protein